MRAIVWRERLSFISRRGLTFGVPRDGYRKAIAQMRRHERDAAAGSALDASDSMPAAGLFAWNAIGPIPLLNEIPTFGDVALGTALPVSRVGSPPLSPTQP